MRSFILFFVLILSVNYLYAEYRLNFFVGDVKVKINGENAELKNSMVIPKKAVIVTGKKSQAHLYDSSRGTRLTIGPEVDASIYLLEKIKKNSDSEFYQNFKKGFVYTGRSTAAAVRGEEEGRINLDWALSEDDIGDEMDRAVEWNFFEKSDYSPIIPMTRDATDFEGMFLFAASVYFHEGDKSGDKAVPLLEKIIAGSTDIKLKTESMRLLSSIYFSQSFYDKSYELMQQASKCTHERDISEADYFVLLQSLFFINRIEEGRKYLRLLKAYYPASPLINQIIEY